MTNAFDVVGEKDDGQHLLVVGDDGQYYGYSMARGEMTPIDPDEHWSVDDDWQPPAEAGAEEGDSWQQSIRSSSG